MSRTLSIAKYSSIGAFIVTGLGVLLGWLTVRSVEENMIESTKELTAQHVAAEVEREFKSIDELLRPKVGADYGVFTAKVEHLNLGPNVERVKIWNKDSCVVWSDEERIVGRSFPDNEELEKALSGKVSSELFTREKTEHEFEKDGTDGMLELYVPIRSKPQGEVQVVFEVYLNLGFLYDNLGEQEKSIWFAVICGVLVLHLYHVGVLALVRREETRKRRSEEGT